jgi:uncharacterized protein (DUF924 family)
MQPSAVIDFWFAPGHEERWFAPTPEFDRLILHRFGGLHQLAADGALDHWSASAEGCLALILLLDQMPRNMYRGSARAFATDAKALAVAEHALARGFDQGQTDKARTFLYLPFEHSEDLAHQNRSVALFEAMGDAEKLDDAVRHRRIVARFGRFPHRNQALGRASTDEELAFLGQPGSSF